MHGRAYATLGVSLLVAIPVPGASQTSCPKIDVHQHAHPLSMYGNPTGPENTLRMLCENDRAPCAKPPSQYTTDAAVLQGTLEYMRRHNVVRAYVSAMDTSQLRRWTRAAPSRFVAGVAIVSVAAAPPIDSLRVAFRGKQLGLLGEMGTQYSGVRPNDEALAPYFALAEEMGVPVLIHTLGIGARVPTFRVAAGNPLLLDEVLARHPKLRLYVENAGYPFADEMIAMLYQYPQLYADLSTITWLIPRQAFHDYLNRLVRAGFVDRLMFGSDQMAWPETIGMAVDAIESAPYLASGQKCDIFFNNALRFFGLNGDSLRKAAWR